MPSLTFASISMPSGHVVFYLSLAGAIFTWFVTSSTPSYLESLTEKIRSWSVGRIGSIQLCQEQLTHELDRI